MSELTGPPRAPDTQQVLEILANLYRNDRHSPKDFAHYLVVATEVAFLHGYVVGQRSGIALMPDHPDFRALKERTPGALFEAIEIKTFDQRLTAIARGSVVE